MSDDRPEPDPRRRRLEWWQADPPTDAELADERYEEWWR